MKKLIILALLSLFSFVGYSQSIDYPRIEKDSLGNSIVLMTIEQAQKLDNNTDLLLLFENLNSQIGTMDSICLKVVNEKDAVIATQSIQISDLKSSIKIKDDKISELQGKITQLNKSIVSLKTEIDNKNTEINLHISEIKKTKTRFALYGGGAGLLIGFILGIFAIH